MNIKSLLLGSAAALVAVSGARAADAIIAEPEPVEYVRVCDAYGAGFFYIPGTETCMQVSGYVWYQIGAETFDAAFDPLTGAPTAMDTPDFLTYGSFPEEEGWIKSTRARVNFDVRSETEWGTLRGFIRMQGTWGDSYPSAFSDGPVAVDQAFLELGGFRAGYTESAWNESMYSGVASYGSHSWGSLYYGDMQRHQISYSFGSAEGFAATISLEDDVRAGDAYIPDVVGVISYNAGWGGVWAKAGYQNDIDRTSLVYDDGFGVQAGLQWNVPNFEGSSFRLLGYYADSDTTFSVGNSMGIFMGGNGAAEWAVLASYYHQFTPTFGASIGAQYMSDLYLPGTDLSSGVDAWIAEASLVWTPIENFEVRSEVYYDDADGVPGDPALGDPDGTWSGFLRFTRYF